MSLKVRSTLSIIPLETLQIILQFVSPAMSDDTLGLRLVSSQFASSIQDWSLCYLGVDPLTLLEELRAWDGNEATRPAEVQVVIPPAAAKWRYRKISPMQFVCVRLARLTATLLPPQQREPQTLAPHQCQHMHAMMASFTKVFDPIHPIRQQMLEQQRRFLIHSVESATPTTKVPVEWWCQIADTFQHPYSPGDWFTFRGSQYNAVDVLSHITELDPSNSERWMQLGLAKERLNTVGMISPEDCLGDDTKCYATAVSLRPSSRTWLAAGRHLCRSGQKAFMPTTDVSQQQIVSACAFLSITPAMTLGMN